MGKNKEVSCKICFKSMRSNNFIRHMKVHIIYTLEDQTVNNEYICDDIVLEIVDTMFVQDESATERKHYGEHDTANCTTTKRKLTDDGHGTTAKRKPADNDTYDQSIIKIKLGEDELDLDALRKTLKEQTTEHDCTLALGKAVENICKKH